MGERAAIAPVRMPSRARPDALTPTHLFHTIPLVGMHRSAPSVPANATRSRPTVWLACAQNPDVWASASMAADRSSPTPSSALCATARARSRGSMRCSKTINTEVRRTPGCDSSRITTDRTHTERAGAPIATFPAPAASAPRVHATRPYTSAAAGGKTYRSVPRGTVNTRPRKTAIGSPRPGATRTA